MSNLRVPGGDGPTTVVMPVAERPASLAAGPLTTLRRTRTPWWESVLNPTPIDVSVCIANWNCRDMLRACLNSIYEQSQGVRLETIVIDNASADGAADMVASEFPEVRLQRNAVNVGFARANNQAARLARGRYLFFLNNDTVLPAAALQRLLAFAQAQPHAGIIGPLLRDGEGKVQSSYRLRPTIGTLLHRTCMLRWTGLLRIIMNATAGKTATWKRRAVESAHGSGHAAAARHLFECGGWDDEYHFGGEDLDLCYRVGQRHPLLFHPDVKSLISAASVRDCTSALLLPKSPWALSLPPQDRGLTVGPRALKTMITIDAPLQWLTKACSTSGGAPRPPR